MDRDSASYSLQGSSSPKVFKDFNGLGAIAFSFGDAMLPEIQVTLLLFHQSGPLLSGLVLSFTVIISISLHDP